MPKLRHTQALSRADVRHLCRNALPEMCRRRDAPALSGAEEGPKGRPLDVDEWRENQQTEGNNLMRLYLLTQNENTGYDTYDSCVVAAKDEDQARGMFPGKDKKTVRADLERDLWEEYDWICAGDEVSTEKSWQRMDMEFSGWTSVPSKVKIEYIGEAKKGTRSGGICASFNAG
jgi:hypothetical protein